MRTGPWEKDVHGRGAPPPSSEKKPWQLHRFSTTPWAIFGDGAHSRFKKCAAQRPQNLALAQRLLLTGGQKNGTRNCTCDP